jgi:hypothetical protein
MVYHGINRRWRYLMEEDFKSGQERKEELQEKILRDLEDLKETTDQAEKEGWY